jgi:hypothetical protein
VMHVVVHRHRRGDQLFLHECVDPMLISVKGKTTEVRSLILTGSEAEKPPHRGEWKRARGALVLYGTDDPRLQRRVDRIRRRRVAGLCKPESAEQHRHAARIYFALTDPLFGVGFMPEEGNDGRVALPSGLTLWDRYIRSHRARREDERRRLAKEILQELISRVGDLPRVQVLTELTRQVNTSGRPRPAHQKPETLAVAIAGLSDRTARRRLRFSLDSVAIT